MRVFFTVQGEGRGHLTQAIAMKEMIERRGHEVVAVLVGSNGTRSLPDYFASAFEVPVERLVSPGFTFRQARGVSASASLLRLARDLPGYRRSLQQLRHALERTAPDLVINFLELTMGLHNLLRGACVPTLVVGHQYMLEHPEYVKVPEHGLQQQLMRAYLRLVGARSSRLALSFYPASDLRCCRLAVCPPLLRRALFEVEPTAGDHLLVYLLNHGYAHTIRRWHTLHPHIPIHCFYDRPEAPPEERVAPNLTFHRLHAGKFLRLMASARAVVCTAGFESVSEAAYLGKPLLMIPVENHVEQYLNARDAELARLGLHDDAFRIERILNPVVRGAPPALRRWVDRAEAIAMPAVEAAAGLRPLRLAPVPVAAMTREPVA